MLMLINNQLKHNQEKMGLEDHQQQEIPFLWRKRRKKVTLRKRKPRQYNHLQNKIPQNQFSI
jgi:hypothetical protein